VSLVVKRYNDLTEPLLFYKGTERLRFSPSKWLWLRELADGKLQPLEGVTTVLKATHNASEPLINWALKQSYIKFKALLLASHMGPNKAFEIWENELDALIVEAKKAAKEKLEDAGDVGTMAHNHLEKIAKATLKDDSRRLIELVALLPPEPRAESCVIAGILWCVEHDIEWVYSERPVYSRIHGVCGTLDNIAWASSCKNPLCCPTPFTRRRVQIDYKSSNALRVEYCLQTGLYTMAFEEEFPDEVIEDRFILRLDKETAEFEPWHLEGRELQKQDADAYLAALQCYRTSKAVEERMNTVRSQRREAEKIVRDAEKEAAHRIACPKSEEYKGARKTKCFTDGTQCAACSTKYLANHPENS
jgi:hypothetical protein